MKLYLAGPLFTTGERDFNVALAVQLRSAGHEVFLPQESEQNHMSPRAIFFSDVNGIDWADAVVACMDGPDPDSGTCWECGYAYGQRKRVVLYRTDIRSEAGVLGPFNLMLHQATKPKMVLDCRGLSPYGVAQKVNEVLG